MYHNVIVTIIDFQVWSIEVGGNGGDYTKIDQVMAAANYTKVLHMMKGQDSVYVRNDLRSAVFGNDQIPKLISWPQ